MGKVIPRNPQRQDSAPLQSQWMSAALSPEEKGLELKPTIYICLEPSLGMHGPIDFQGFVLN